MRICGAQSSSWQTLLEQAPGPSPWYLRAHGPRLEGANGVYRWEPPSDDGEQSGQTILRRSDQTPVGMFGFYCYVRALGGPRFVTWFPEASPSAGGAVSPTAIQFRIVNADHLAGIEDLARTSARLVSERRATWLVGGVEAAAGISTALPPGTNHVELPPAFHELDELLVLVDATAAVRTVAGPVPQRCIWVIRPRDSTIEVLPQDWFNEGSFDFGYQWITRVARDPVSGQLIGDGIRLGAFELDATGRNVARWFPGAAV